MGIQSLDASTGQGGHQLRSQVAWERGEVGGGRGKQMVQRYVTWEIGWVEGWNVEHAALGRLDEHPFAVKR
jgi:hypothetical protein